MNQIKLIDEREVLGKQFKVYGDIENPLFLAKDVAEWIEHSDVSTMTRAIDDSEKLIQTIFVSGQNREVLMLTEDGLYEVLMQSRKPIAKQFKKEVKVILKSIRKNGAYMTENTLEQVLNNPDFGIQLLTKLKEEQEARKVLEVEVQQNRPKVLFADSVATSKNTILIGEMAKILKGNGVDIGQNRLFKWMRDNGYLIKREGTDFNMPTLYSMELGLFQIKETVINHSDGHTSVSKTPKVTGKGQLYFTNLFLTQRKGCGDDATSCS